MRHIHLDPVGGVAGDMFVAAMLDLLPGITDRLWQDLHDSGVLQHVEVGLQPGSSGALAVKRLEVTHRQHAPSRTGNYRDLRRWLDDSSLNVAVKRRTQALLLSLAEAEAFVHGIAVEDVHFHEVADWDSIADLVAAASAIENAGVGSWSCGALPLGSGLVQTEHGRLPVPAPATVRLLEGFPVWDDGEPGERVTPTGAAIVRHVLAIGSAVGQLPPASSSSAPPGTLAAAGCGAGQRQLQQRPNILRCLLIERLPEGAADTTKNVAAHAAAEVVEDGADARVATDRTAEAAVGLATASFECLEDEVLELCFDIDDMTPEELAVSLDQIRAEAGVLDVVFQLAIGKKGRAVFAVRVLCSSSEERGVSARCFEETTTLGMRVQPLRRHLLPRRLSQVPTLDGIAGIKSVIRPSGVTTVKVESDDLAHIRGLQARRDHARRIREPFEA